MSESKIPSHPPGAWKPLVKISNVALKPLERFLQIEAASGILLLAAAAIALILVNSSWSEEYLGFWQIPVGIRLGSFSFERSLTWIVNDGLMAIFFFVVGLEIKREIHRGELSEWRRAALPVAAALGGMAIPALIYLIFANAPEVRSGWGVPMATDIAFAIGVLALLGKRIPPALRVLLLAVAVIDDLGAIIVIAVFYSSGIVASGFLMAAIGLAVILGMQRLGIRSKTSYILPGTLLWAGIYNAGIHPTIAGVIIGLATPIRPWLGPEGFLRSIQWDLEVIKNSTLQQSSTHEISTTLRHFQTAGKEVLSPADSLIELLHPWVAYGIMPIFAFANAGVAVSAVHFDASSTMVVAGIVMALFLGKPVGILLSSWIVLKLRIGVLPAGIHFRHLLVMGLVAGVGFTMSIFIAQLAFSDEKLLGAAKIGILVASVCAAVTALLLGRLTLDKTFSKDAAQSADEAESSTLI